LQSIGACRRGRSGIKLSYALLFGKDKELRARALYNLTQLWSEIGQPEQAAVARETLQHDFPNSTWNQKLGS